MRFAKKFDECREYNWELRIDNLAIKYNKKVFVSDDVKEKIASAKLIWVLSFSDINRGLFVQKHPDIVEVLKKLQSDTKST